MKPTIELLLIMFLRRNIDVFTWKASELQGINPLVIVHRLNMDLAKRPIRQKTRYFGEDKK